MARYSVEIKHLFRLVGFPVREFYSACQVWEAEALAKKTGEIAKKSSEYLWNRNGASSMRDYTKGSGSLFPRSVHEGNSTMCCNRGMQGLRGELRLQGGTVAPFRLLRSSFFSVSNNLGGKGALKSEFNPSRNRTNVRGWRSYYVDNRGVRHFKRRGPAAWSETMSSQRSMVWIGGTAVVGGIVYVTNLETVPYTHRKHFVLVSPLLERSIGERGFKMLLKEYKSRVLPPSHPETVRVHRIGGEIIEALMLGTRTSDWGSFENGGDYADFEVGPGWDTVTKKSEASLLGHAHSHDDSVDEAWVDESRKEGLRKGEEGFTKHLQGMQWQVIVVDDDTVNAVCLPGGKIVVFTGLLKKFRSETEIATVIAHEVGHAVARHSAESLTHNLILVAFQLAVLSVFYVPSLVNSVSELLLRLPFSRRMEIEADRIGLILMAAAGYDPRLAPGLYEKLASIENNPEYAQYLSTHPSGKKRGEKLRSSGTMEEAMSLYRQKMAGRGVDGFF